MRNPLQDLKKANYEHYHLPWKIAQAGGLDPLPKKDQLLAGIMMEHEEHHDQFQISDLLHDHKYDTESEEYKSLLKRYKNKKPDKIQSSLVREFGTKRGRAGASQGPDRSFSIIMAQSDR
jgi:hypothetical protein